MSEAIDSLGPELSRAVRKLFREFVEELCIEVMARPGANAALELSLEVQDGQPVFGRVMRTRKSKFTKAA